MNQTAHGEHNGITPVDSVQFLNIYLVIFSNLTGKYMNRSEDSSWVHWSAGWLPRLSFNGYSKSQWTVTNNDFGHETLFDIIERECLTSFQSALNGVSPDIQFTSEEVKVQELPFMDVLICNNDNGELLISVLRKVINMDRIMFIDSKHMVPQNVVLCTEVTVLTVRELYRISWVKSRSQTP